MKDAGKKVAVIGSGATGLEVADTLKTKDPSREVSVIEMTSTLGASEIQRVRVVVLKRLENKGVELLPLHTLVGVNDKGIKLKVTEEGKDPVEKEMEFDTVVLALGSRPQKDCTEEFKGLGKVVRTYGDSVKIATLLEALRDARFAAWAY